MNRQQRVLEFLKRLEESPAKNDFDGARAQLDSVVEAVENELCPPGEARMGPPLDDNRRSVPGRPEVTRFRTRGHNVFIRANGAIRIEELPDGVVRLDKPGSNGKRVLDP